MILSGRGWGKTRCGAEWTAWNALSTPYTRWCIIAPTFSDARDTCLEGESGLLTVLNRYKAVQKWNRSLGELLLINGSRVKLFSADEPERLRGPQFHGAWCDELAAWRYPETYDQLKFGLRLGKNPQIVVTTTPKPTKLVREIAAAESTVVTRGSTFDNAKNLAGPALAQLLARYEGTRMGRQELYGEILEDIEGALWSQGLIDQHRKAFTPEVIARRVIAVDPAVTNSDSSAETGIVVCSRDMDGHGYVEGDFSLRGTPDQWAKRTVELFDTMHCNHVVVEVNQGGDMVVNTLRSVRPSLPIRQVRASKGKRLRAEPISAMYEQGRIHHVGTMALLEEQMTSWSPDDPRSPDRIDALVWALTDLMDSGSSENFLRAIANICSCGFPNRLQAVVCGKCGTSIGGARG